MKSWFESGMLRTVVQQVFPWTEAKGFQSFSLPVESLVRW